MRGSPVQPASSSNPSPRARCRSASGCAVLCAFHLRMILAASPVPLFSDSKLIWLFGLSAGFLNISTTDVWDCVFFVVGLWCALWRVSSIPGFYLLERCKLHTHTPPCVLTINNVSSSFQKSLRRGKITQGKNNCPGFPHAWWALPLLPDRVWFHSDGSALPSQHPLPHIIVCLSIALRRLASWPPRNKLCSVKGIYLSIYIDR